MKKPKFILIDYVIYPFNVLVCIGTTDKETVNYIKRKFRLEYELSNKEVNMISMEKLSEGRTIMLSSGATILRLKSLRKTPHSLSMLSHEVFHAVEFLCSKLGIAISNDSDEAYAYLVQYLTKQILTKYFS